MVDFRGKETGDLRRRRRSPVVRGIGTRFFDAFVRFAFRYGLQTRLPSFVRDMDGNVRRNM